MNPISIVGQVAVAVLVGSICVSMARGIAGGLDKVPSFGLLVLGLGASSLGTWFVYSRGAPEALMLLGAITAVGTGFGALGRAGLGGKAPMLVATGVLAEACALGGWLAWYSPVGQPWLRGVAVGLLAGVLHYVAVLLLVGVHQVVVVGRWVQQELSALLRSPQR